MRTLSPITAATIAGALALTAFVCGSVMAQAGKPGNLPPAAGTPGTAPQSAGPQIHTDDEPDADAATQWAPVLKVTSIEVMRSAHPPQLDVIRVKGITSTDAWEGPDLVPLSTNPATSTTLQLLFVAKAPTDGIPATAYGTVEAIFVIEPGHPYTAIRVRGATNSLTLRTMPGYVETAVPAADCSSCVGKYFVAKGGSAPGGATQATMIREEDLPANVRVLKASDGVAKLDTDPNRLTLILGEDGRIELAVWD